MLALVGATLYVLEIRDVRCYAAAAIWVPTISGMLLGNVSIPLAFALAVVWRYRESVRPPAIALGLAVSAKLLLWPVFVWVLATRRLRTAALALAVGAAVTVVAWAVIGFAGLGEYPDLLRRLSELQSERSYSIVGMAATLGVGEGVGRAATLVVGGVLLVACVLLARRGDEERSFTCAVAATLALSPIVWLHYLVLLLVPLAILRPRFSLLWLLPVLLWVSPRPGYAEGYETFMPGLVAVILVAAAARAAARLLGCATSASMNAGTSVAAKPAAPDWWRTLSTGALVARGGDLHRRAPCASGHGPAWAGTSATRIFDRPSSCWTAAPRTPSPTTRFSSRGRHMSTRLSSRSRSLRCPHYRRSLLSWSPSQGLSRHSWERWRCSVCATYGVMRRFWSGGPPRTRSR